MAAKVKASSRPASLSAASLVSATPAALTIEERLHRIEAMRKRIDSYIQFMCQIPGLSGSSSERKEHAVAVFYEQMVLVEQQLGHIHDEFRLE
jgi:hypothetical protein